MKTIKIKEQFKDDYITRAAGERLRHMILKSKTQSEPIELDFSELIVGSTSFFDEGIAKLAEEGWNLEQFTTYVKITGINHLDLKVMKQVQKFRGLN